MKGSVIKRGSTYSIVYDVGRDPATNKRLQKWEGGYKTKKEAEKALTEVLYRIENNTYIKPEKQTLGEYLNYWYSTHEKNLAPSTARGYRTNIEKHIIPSIGNIPLQKLQPLQIQQFYTEKLNNGRLDGKGGLSAKSVIYIHRNLREALEFAKRKELIQRNVADWVDLPKAKKYKSSVLSEEEAKQLISICEKTRLYIPINLAICLGLRRGEVLGLRWSDIDFKNNTMNINQTLMIVDKKLIFGPPKSDNSNRTIKVPPFLMSILKKHRKKQLEFKLLLGNEYQDKEDLVCCNEDGSPFSPNSLNHSFTRLLKNNNLKHIRFHDLRHTNATLMLKQNISPKIASQRLGHSTIAITMDLYSHVLTDMQEEASNKLEDILYSNSL